MVLRQSCMRHSRNVLHASNKHIPCRRYASEASPSEISKMLSSIEQRADQLERNQKSLRSEIYETMSERISSSLVPATADSNLPASTTTSDAPKKRALNKFAFDARLNRQKKVLKMGSALKIGYVPGDALKRPPAADDLTLPMLMAAQTHLGHATSLWNPRNSSYIFGIRDGIHIISLDTTLAYLRRAARVVREVALRGGIILFVGTRDRQEDLVVRAARMAGGYHIFERWIPGLLTNGQQLLEHCSLKVVDVLDKELPEPTRLLSNAQQRHSVLKPDLVVCLNPMENEVCLHECGLNTIPTIGVIDTDADASRVTYPIPANDDSLRSMTLISGVLGNAGAEGQRQRMQQAASGRAAYDSGGVKLAIKSMEELGALQLTSNKGDE